MTLAIKFGSIVATRRDERLVVERRP